MAVADCNQDTVGLFEFAEQGALNVRHILGLVNDYEVVTPARQVKCNRHVELIIEVEFVLLFEPSLKQDVCPSNERRCAAAVGVNVVLIHQRIPALVGGFVRAARYAHAFGDESVRLRLADDVEQLRSHLARLFRE